MWLILKKVDFAGPARHSFDMRRRLYHGTTADFDEFRLDGIGVHFGTREQANERLMSRFSPEEGRLIQADVRIKNPLRMEDVHLWQLPKFVIKGMRGVGLWSDAELALVPAGLNDSSEVQNNSLKVMREMIENMGFDGVVYSNVGEGRKPKDSFIAFSLSQIRVKNSGRRNSDFAPLPGKATVAPLRSARGGYQ